MSFSYDDTLTEDCDKVRFMLADTDETKAMLSDEAIGNMLSLYGNVFDAAATLADGLATKFARIPTISIDGVSIRGSDRADQYRTLAAELRRQSSQGAPGALGIPFVGGISQSEEQTVATDTDRVPNKFSVGMDDFPGTSMPTVPPNVNDELP